MTNETNGISLRRLKTFLTNLKNIFAEKNHSHVTSDITGLDTVLSSKATLAQGNKADSAVQSVKIGTTEYKSGTTVTLPSYPTSLPASDVPSWAKQKTKPTYNASEIGLGNVGNFKAVSTVASQGLTDTEKSNARANIGAQVAGSYASVNHNHDDKYQAKGSYASASHTHTKSQITDFPTSMPANGGTATYANYVWATSHQGSWYQNSQWDGTYFQTNYKNGNNVLPMKVNNARYADSADSVAWSNVSGRPSSMPASDVYPWAKASSKPSYTASEVGAAPANHSHSNYLTGITKSMVVNALGYTPPTTDTNTWRGVQNNLTSTATDQSLSAYQGKILKDLVDKKTTFTYSSTQPTSPASNAVWVG